MQLIGIREASSLIVSHTRLAGEACSVDTCEWTACTANHDSMLIAGVSPESTCHESGFMMCRKR